MEGIIQYLKDTYDPISILVYGSYLRGDYDEYSDFDCTVIVEDDDKTATYDYSIVNGVQLDCIIFSRKEALWAKHPSEFVKMHNAQIIIDDGTAKTMLEHLHEYMDETAIISDDRRREITSWIIKMTNRFDRDGTDGDYSIIFFLWQSLLLYCRLRGLFYCGPKETMSYLKDNDSLGYELANMAIGDKSVTATTAWANYIIGIT